MKAHVIEKAGRPVRVHAFGFNRAEAYRRLGKMGPIAGQVLPGIEAVGEIAAGRDRAAITRQLDRYEQALNGADIDAVMELYAIDAVLMPQHSLPAESRDAIRTAYRHVFDTAHLEIDFTVEISVLTRDWAYARTRSNGTVKVLASDLPPAPEANQELFLLHRESDGEWRFARHTFSTTNPPANPCGPHHECPAPGSRRGHRTRADGAHLHSLRPV